MPNILHTNTPPKKESFWAGDLRESDASDRIGDGVIWYGKSRVRIRQPGRRVDGDGTAAQQIAHVGSNQVSDGYVSVEIDVDVGPEFNESASVGVDVTSEWLTH